MKISVILLSYNRPNFIRQALSSISSQSHQDFELIVMDESDMFDVSNTIKEFSFPSVSIFKYPISNETRLSQNRIGIKMNAALSMASGDAVAFLCDDDYYFPRWLEGVSDALFENHEISVVYGKLYKSWSLDMRFPPSSEILWPGIPISDPAYKLDHNQVAHRNFGTRYKWPEDMDIPHVREPDAFYFLSLSRDHIFYPLNIDAAVKRFHLKNFQLSINQNLPADGIRE